MKTKVRRIVSLFLALMMVVLILPISAIALETDDKSSVTVYFTMTRDGEFVTGNDESQTCMARVPVTIEYFDLADYGLEEFYRYESDSFENGGGYISDTVIEQPTLLHLFIRMLEQYYMGDGSKLSVGSEALNISGSATSLFMQEFWGYDLNLMYFVDHEYPLMAEGWGATADYILLEDGMDIEVGSFSGWSIWTDGAFASFTPAESNIEVGDTVSFETYKTSTTDMMMGSYDMAPKKSGPLTSTVLYDSDWNKVEDLTVDESGEFSYTFNNAGTYYIAGYGDSAGTETANTVPAVSTVYVNDSGIDYSEYPFTNVTLEDGETQLSEITKSKLLVDPWESGTNTEVNLYQIKVPENTEYVYVTYPSDADISSEYCAWYDYNNDDYPATTDGDYEYELLDDGSKRLKIKVDKNNDGKADVFLTETASSYAFMDAFVFTSTGTEIVEKPEYLSELTIKDSDNTVLTFNPAFESKVFDYSVSIEPDETQLTVTAKTNASNATVSVNGTALENNTYTVQVSDETNYIDVTITTENGTLRTYKVALEKLAVVNTEVIVNPEDAIIYITDLKGNRVLPNNDGTYSIYEGTEYYYVVSKNGYAAVSGSKIADENALSVELEEVVPNEQINNNIPSSWPSFRGSNDNNTVVDALIPTTADDALLYWAEKLGEGYGNMAAGCPIFVDGDLVLCASDNILKVDSTTGEIIASAKMSGRSSFNIIPPTYADGMIFVGLANGTVQAFNAKNLESLWIYKDALKGQPNSPITYYDGYIYTGFWNGETKNANLVCLSVSDENPEKTDEEKTATWLYTQKGGFYWAGAYVCEDFLLVGTDDGENGYLSDTSCILSLDPKTGYVLDKMENLDGDIRSSVSYDTSTERYYFTTKGGSFYGISADENGKLSDLKSIKLSNGSDSESKPPMSTCTPVIYNGRAYVGVSGSSQFGMYSGHNITVLDLTEWEIAYTVPVKGYPQTSGLLTNGYEDEDGYVYVYFIANYTPGQIRVIKDKPGVTSVVDGVTESYTSGGETVYVEGCAPVLFTPSGEQAQYAICSPIVDEYGTLYFKNDSGYMMAVGSKIESIEVVTNPEKTVYTEGEVFNADGIKVIAHLANGLDRDITDYVTYSSNSEALTAEDTDVTIYYNYVMYGDNLDAENGNVTNVEAVIPETYVDVTVLTNEQLSEVQNVIDLIDAIGEVTLESEEEITTARSAYDELDEDLKALVSNYDILVSAEEELANLKADIEEPTEVPSESPTEKPIETPSEAPTEEPTEAPSESSTEEPKEIPTEELTEIPSDIPIEKTTENPTQASTEKPAEASTQAATQSQTQNSNQNQSSDLPKTGDNSINMYVYLMFVASLDVIVVAFFRKKNLHNNY